MIASARKLLPIVLVILLVVTIGIFTIIEVNNRPTVDQQLTNILGKERPIGRIGQGYFNFEIANTVEKRTLGLSGRAGLAPTEALLFVYDTPSKDCFWMKDMKFSIDILWFDSTKKLFYEKRNVSPSTYPEKFCPPEPAKYVAEVAAGVAANNQIMIGNKLDIEL